jgi:hypothetical protein
VLRRFAYLAEASVDPFADLNLEMPFQVFAPPPPVPSGPEHPGGRRLEKVVPIREVGGLHNRYVRLAA